MKNKTIGLYIFLVVLFSILSCKDVNKDDLVFPAYDLSYSQHIRPLLYRDCGTGSSCHTSNYHAASLDFENPFLSSDDYAIQRNEWAGYFLITPYRPDLSVLYLILADSTRIVIPGVDRMPPIERKPLGKEEITAIWKWIGEGADVYN